MDTLQAGQRATVIGGGVVGCATAYVLARGGLEVTLIERDAIAAHASGRNAGNLNPLHGTPSALIPLALDAFRLHAQILSELAILDCANYQLLPVSRIYLGYDESDRRQLAETATRFEKAEGFSAAWLDRDDLHRIEPRLSPDVAVGVLTRGNLSVDGSDFARSLATGAARLGATVAIERACGLTTSGDRVSGVQTDRGHIGCDAVVLATGPWVADTKCWLGIDVPVEPVKGELLLMRMMGDAPAFDLTWGLTSLYRRRGNEMWVGVTEEHAGFDDTPTADARERLLTQAERIMPVIRRAEPLAHIAGLRPVSALQAPIAARADGWRNVYIANGGGFKGLLLSVGIAKTIRDLLLVDHDDHPRSNPIR